MTSTVIATRGERLALSRVRLSGRDQRPEAFHTELLGIVEINADNRIAARVAFDLDDIDAAFEELDARYLAGEAAAHAHTWSVIAGAYAALNRHELPATTPDWVNIDHRRATAFAPGDLTAYIRAAWDVAPDVSGYIEAVHRLSDLGAVVTQAVNGTSQEGFDAEWRVIDLLTVDGDLINRCELFDEADIDAALARFDELSPPARRLENAASQVDERFWTYFAARDWDAMAEILADDYLQRRSSSGGGRGRPTRSGCRDREHAGDRRRRGHEHDVDRHCDPRRAPRPQSCPLLGPRPAARGVPHRDPRRRRDRRRQPDRGGRLRSTSTTSTPPSQELDARYLAGEAAAHSHTWSVIARGLRCDQPARTPCDDAGLGEHRPPARRSRSRPAT